MNSPSSTSTSPSSKSAPARRGRRVMHGVVVRRSGAQTVSVEVRHVVRHPRYGKQMTRSKRYLAHDPQNAVVVGSSVTIRESRPLSRRKRWVVVS